MVLVAARLLRARLEEQNNQEEREHILNLLSSISMARAAEEPAATRGRRELSAQKWSGKSLQLGPWAN